MGSKTTEITHDFSPFFSVDSAGNVQRHIEHDFVPPGEDKLTGVLSKDVVVSLENGVSARLFLPKAAAIGGSNSNSKLPLIVYFHGGAFSVQSAFSSIYHSYVNSLAAAAGCVVVSIEYRLAPEHPIPACYDDCAAAIEWVGLHAPPGQGPDPWLNEHADFLRVYAAGDSAGANIAHNMAIEARSADFGFQFSGIILIHPFFGMGKADKLWDFICSEPTGPDDVRLNPAAHPNFPTNLGCKGLLVCVAEQDFLRERGRRYFEAVKKGQWKGAAELFETPGEQHVFFLFDPAGEPAVSLMNRIVGFINSCPGPLLLSEL